MQIRGRCLGDLASEILSSVSMTTQVRLADPELDMQRAHGSCNDAVLVCALT